MSFFSSISNAVSNLGKAVTSTVSNAVEGVGDILQGQVGQGLEKIAPAAVIGGGLYASGLLDPLLGTAAPAAAAPAALAPTAASYGGVLGGGSTALTGGIAPEVVGGITASGIGSVLPSAAGSTIGSTIGSTLSSLLPTTSAGLAALGAGAGSAISGLLGANAATDAAKIQADAAKAASANQLAMFNTLNTQQAPYRASGYSALNDIGAMMPGQYTKYDAAGNPIGQATGSGYLTQMFGPQEFAAGIDPGYAFRLQQGQMANERASNLAGGLIGGNALKGMQDYTQGMASQEYGNAFNRFQTQRGNIYNTLAGIAGIGQTAQTQANQLGQNTATAQGQLGVGSAAAQAAGQIGQANALGNAAGGVGNAYMLSQLLGQNQGAAGNLSGSNFMNAYNAIG
jgi:hypothetical protein